MVSIAQGRFVQASITSDVFASSELTNFYADPGSEDFLTAAL
jgi:hypothetical protein